MAAPATVADAVDAVSDDFALSDTASGELPSEGDEPTPEEIEEWANVESPAVASFPSSQSDKDATEASPKHGGEHSDEDGPTRALLEEATAAAAQLAGTPEPAEDASVSRNVSTPPAPAPPPAATSAAAASAAAASGSESWGWAGGWGWQKLREAAAEAAKDVAELKESFQQVLAEVATPEEADEEPSPVVPARPAAARTATPEPEAESVKTREILHRLEGPDTQLEVGLKAIDDQMEQLATGAAKALTSLWGGLAVVAKGTLTTGHSIATKVENVTLELAKELVQSVEDGVKDASTGLKGVSQLASRAERSLENVGRTALDFLEEAAGQRGGAQGQGEAADSFEGCFHAFGGRRAYEELEGLANECSRLCNRTRARLEADQKAAVDETLVELGPLFDLVASDDAEPSATTAADPTAAPPPASEPAAHAAAPAEPAEGPAAATEDADRQQAPPQPEQGEAASQESAEGAEARPAGEEKKQVDGGAVEGSGTEGGSQVAAAVVKGAQRRPTKEVEEQLRGEYEPVADLHQAGLRRVEVLLEALRLEAAAGAEELAAAAGAAPAATAAKGSSQEATEDTEAKEATEAAEAPGAAKAPAGKDATAPAGEAGSKDEAAPSSSSGSGGVSTPPAAPAAASGMVLVRRMKQETVQCLAELCATELQLLLRLGRSIVAPARYGRPADDGIQWPAAAVAKAVLLHRTARKMAADIEASADAFLKALSAVEELVAAQLLDEAAAQTAEAAVADLELECGTAAARVQEAFRNLLYIVLLSSLHSQGLLKA